MLTAEQLQKILLLTLILTLILSSSIVIANTKAEICEYQVEYTEDASKADIAFTKKIIQEMNKGKTLEYVLDELGFETSDETIYMFEIFSEGQSEKTGKVIKIKDDKYEISHDGILIESGDIGTLDTTVIGDFVTLELRHSRGSDPEVGEYYVLLKYDYDYNSGSNFYKDAYAVAWDTRDVYATSIVNTSNLILDSQGVGWRGYEVNNFSGSGSVWTVTRPRAGIAVGDAHGEYMSEYAHAYGAPANWSISGSLFGFVSIGYTTQGSVNKDFASDYF